MAHLDLQNKKELLSTLIIKFFNKGVIETMTAVMLMIMFMSNVTLFCEYFF